MPHLSEKRETLVPEQRTFCSERTFSHLSRATFFFQRTFPCWQRTFSISEHFQSANLFCRRTFSISEPRAAHRNRMLRYTAATVRLTVPYHEGCKKLSCGSATVRLEHRKSRQNTAVYGDGTVVRVYHQLEPPHELQMHVRLLVCAFN